MKADAKNYKCPEKKAMASSYHGMGTVSTFKHIYEKRGIPGLFIGGRMHLGMASSWNILLEVNGT